MIPFLCSSGGGSQTREMDRLLVVVTTIFCGISLGAIKSIDASKYLYMVIMDIKIILKQLLYYFITVLSRYCNIICFYWFSILINHSVQCGYTAT